MYISHSNVTETLIRDLQKKCPFQISKVRRRGVTRRRVRVFFPVEEKDYEAIGKLFSSVSLPSFKD